MDKTETAYSKNAKYVGRCPLYSRMDQCDAAGRWGDRNGYIAIENYCDVGQPVSITVTCYNLAVDSDVRAMDGAAVLSNQAFVPEVSWNCA